MGTAFFYFLVIAITLSVIAPAIAISAQKMYHDYTVMMNKKMDLEMKKIHEKSVSDYRDRRDYR
jgi:hypothetical protein